MAKSADAFRTISEVAEWLDTPAHVLRFWESRFNQVKPIKRAGGRRYYRPNDMLLLGGIKKLLHEDGMTIKGAQKLLRTDGVKKVSALSQPLDAEDGNTIDVKPQVIAPIEAKPIDAPTAEVITPDAPATLSVVASDEPETEAEDETEAPSEPDQDSQAVPEPEPEIIPDPVPKQEPEQDTQPTPEPEPETIPESEPETPPEPETKEEAAETTPQPVEASGEDDKSEQLSSIFNRLTALHDRMKSDIDPK